MPKFDEGKKPGGEMASSSGSKSKTMLQSTGALSISRIDAAKQVKAALRGPVMRTLAEGIPEVRNMPGVVAYDKIMGDITLLEQCFGYFRASRDKFHAILVDDQQRQVNDDSAKLSCGRTLNEVVAMIVRSATFRYFNRRLGDRRPLQAAPVKKQGFVSRVLAALTGSTPSPIRQTRSKADLLYEAIREYLLYEWQVPLVPAYSQLSPRDVTRLGPRIVELRSEDDLMIAVGHRRPELPTPKPSQGAALDWSVTPPAPAHQPLANNDKPSLEDILTPDKSRLKVEALGATLLDPEVRNAAQNVEQMTILTSILKQVGCGLVRALVVDLGLGKKQMTVCLLTAQRLLPPSAFEQLAKGSENSPSMLRFMIAAKKSGIGSGSSLEECAAYLSAILATPSNGEGARK